MPLDPYSQAALIGGGFSLLGGFLSNKSASRQNEFNLGWARESARNDVTMFHRQKAHQQEMMRQGQENAIAQLVRGNQEDMYNQRAMYMFRINQGLQAGMTPYEMYMGPAAGAGGGTTGSGSTLGNAANQRTTAAMQLQADLANKAADRQAMLRQTQMQVAGQQAASRNQLIGTLGSAALSTGANIFGSKTAAEATKDAAETSAGASRYQADIQKQIAENRLQLDQKTFDQVTVPGAAAQIGKTEQETRKLINEIATTEPEFVVQMKKWSMGVDNMMVEYFMKEYDINIMGSQKEYLKIPKKKRADFLAAVMAYQSHIAKETKGISGIVQDAMDVLGNEGIVKQPYQYKHNPAQMAPVR